MALRPDDNKAGGSTAQADRPAREALEEVHDAVRRAVRRACPRRLTGQQEDIVQEAMIRVNRVLEERPDSIESWAYVRRVAFNAVLREIERADRRAEVSLDDQGAEPLPAPDPVLDPSASMALRKALRECLAALARHRRLAVVLHLHGYSLAEGAEILRGSSKQMANLRYRGLADLRTCLEGKGVTP
ncbi:hypothetical protein ABI59_16635 [Acidobacteria bacterium Mor1]|nr:hypothetical protein ABI59_16635 [Acidobacteria bacterium Mor1]